MCVCVCVCEMCLGVIFSLSVFVCVCVCACGVSMRKCLIVPSFPSQRAPCSPLIQHPTGTPPVARCGNIFENSFLTIFVAAAALAISAFVTICVYVCVCVCVLTFICLLFFALQDGVFRLWDVDFNPIKSIDLKATPIGYPGMLF